MSSSSETRRRDWTGAREAHHPSAMAKKSTRQKFTAAMLRAGAAAIDGMNALSPIEMARAVLHAAFTPQRPARKKAKRKAPARKKAPVRRAAKTVRKAARKVKKATKRKTARRA
jgi:hypothetical protein